MSDDKLTPEAKAAIRGYMVSLVTLPGLAVALIIFFAGFFLNGVAKDAIQNENTRTLEQILRPAKQQAAEIDAIFAEVKKKSDGVTAAAAAVDDVINKRAAGLVSLLRADPEFQTLIRSLNIEALRELSASADRIKDIAVHYVRTKGMTPENTTEAFSVVSPCPPEFPRAIGGGFDYGDHGINVYYSYPTDGGWLVRAGNQEAGPARVFSSYAVCTNLELR